MGSSNVPAPRLRIAICGGGIAGMALAAFLAAVPDVRVDIYEAKPEIRTIGAGLAVWKRYWDVLEETLDFNSECEARGIARPQWSEVTGPVLRKSDKPPGFEFFSLQHGPMVIARTAILDILHSKVNQNHVHTSKVLSQYLVNDADNGTVHLEFGDGSHATADLLIGADGVHSRVRAEMYAQDASYAEPLFSGQYAYRMKCLRQQLAQAHPENIALEGFKIWCGKGRHVTSNAVGEYIQMTAYDNVTWHEDGPIKDAWVQDVPVADITTGYQGWEQHLRSLLGMTDEASRWAIHVVKDLPSFVSRSVALIGDAAHAMTPHMGLGGGQGIEDAYLLASLLADKRTTGCTLAAALSVYDEIRRPRSQAVAAASLSNGLIYAFLNPAFKDASLEEMGQEFIRSSQWLLDNKDCKGDVAQAQLRLSSLIADVV